MDKGQTNESVVTWIYNNADRKMLHEYTTMQIEKCYINIQQSR